MNVAPLISAFWPRMKSSAVSVSSNKPGPAGRESVAILPSGLPVLNNTIGDAAARAGRNATALISAREPTHVDRGMIFALLSGSFYHIKRTEFALTII
jgi:hypothetical protein